MRPENKGFTASFDMLGEAARTRADAERYFEAYQGAIAAVGANPARGHSVSVKLSALHPRYETAKAATCVPELSAMLVDLARQAASLNVQLTVDAEEAARLEMSLDIIEAAARDPQLERAGTGWGWQCKPIPNALGRCWHGLTPWEAILVASCRSGW
jgi:RHH-type proline utilization regulon transcriptional repressor/proline dehydrogenase/delta 1-pyrroline-5-carboxylate dehydrogenase